MGKFHLKVCEIIPLRERSKLMFADSFENCPFKSDDVKNRGALNLKSAF
jgi:hypothetical protein